MNKETVTDEICSISEITKEDLQKIRNHYIEKFGIKRYLQKCEDGFSEYDLALELLELSKRDSNNSFVDDKDDNEERTINLDETKELNGKIQEDRER